MVTAREVMQLIITGDGRSAVTAVKQVGTAAKTELGAAEQAAVSMHNKMITGGAALATAGAGVLYGLKQTTDAYRTAGLETMKLTRLTGGSAEEMSKMRFVASQSAVGVDSLATGIIRLSRSASGSGGKSALEQLGVDLHDAEGNARSVTDVIIDLAGAFEQTESGLEKNALAMKLFGRGGTDMLLMLNRGSEGIRDLIAQAEQMGLVLDGDDTKQIAAYLGAKRELDAARSSLEMQIGREVFPVISDGMAKAAGATEQLAGFVSDLPGPLKATAGGVIAYGSAAAIAAGGIAFLAGVTNKLSSNLKDMEGDLTLAGKAAGVLSIALGAIGTIQVIDSVRAGIANEAGRLEEARKELLIAVEAGSAEDIIRAFSERAGADTAGLAQNFVEMWGSNFKLLDDVAQETIESIERAFDESTINEQSGILTAMRTLRGSMRDGSQEAKDYDNVIANLTVRYERNKTAASIAAQETGEYGDAADDAGAAARGLAPSLDRATYAFERTADAAEGAAPGAIAYADAVRGAIDPVLAVADANDRLAEAQRKAAEVANPNSKAVTNAAKSVEQAWRSVEQAVRSVADAERGMSDSRERVTDATRSLADAQRELNELLNDDPLFGLKQVPVEHQIADARNRLAEANKALLANPTDAGALTRRDDALADLERATQRRQDQIRQGEQRTKDVASARQRVDDAERGVRDSHRGVADAQRAIEDAKRGVADARAAAYEAAEVLDEVRSQHGVLSEAYAAASRDVVRAALDVQDADAQMAQWLRDNGIDAVDALNQQFDELIARGGPVGAAAASMKEQMDPLVQQAYRYAALLGETITLRDILFGAPPGRGLEAMWQHFTGAKKPGRLDGVRGMGDVFRNDKSPKAPSSTTTTTTPWPTLDPRPNNQPESIPIRRHSGGPIPGGFGKEVPYWGLGGEEVLSHAGVAARRAAGIDLEALNRGIIPRRLNAAPAAAPSTSSGSGQRESIDISIGEITQVVPDPELAGDAVVGALRRIAHRSGMGLRVDRAVS